MRALEAHYRRQALAQGGQDPKYAAISVAQRFDGAARLNVHWHVLCADGAWVQSGDDLQFVPAPPLQQEVVEQVFADVLRRIDRQLGRLLADPDEEPRDKLSQREPAFAALLRNAMLGNQAAGKDAGKPQRVELGKGPLLVKPHGRNCCQMNGYSLHANTTVAPLDRESLEKLCKYVCRPAIAASRMEQVDAQTIRISLKNEWAGGVRAVLLSPRDLVIRALAQIPLPRRASVHYHGCFAPNARARAQVVPAGAKPKSRRKKHALSAVEGSSEERDESTKMTWAQCQKRAFLWDVLACKCGGRRKVIAAVQDKQEIERFLQHLQLWPDAKDIVAICGPPELFAALEVESLDPWDDIDAPQPLDWVA